MLTRIIVYIIKFCSKKMRRMGFEPMRISTLDLETNSLTARTPSLQKKKGLYNYSNFCYLLAKKVRGVGFEPTRISPADLKAASLTTRTSPLLNFARPHASFQFFSCKPAHAPTTLPRFTTR